MKFEFTINWICLFILFLCIWFPPICFQAPPQQVLNNSKHLISHAECPSHSKISTSLRNADVSH